MNRIEKAKEFRKLINANLNATRKLIRVDELDVMKRDMEESYVLKEPVDETAEEELPTE